MSFKLIEQFYYDVNAGEITIYSGTTPYSKLVTFYTKSTNELYNIYVNYFDQNIGTKLFQNYYINDYKGNAISFTVLANTLEGSNITVEGINEYGVSGYYGDKFKDVNLVQIQYNRDGSRYIRLYNFS